MPSRKQLWTDQLPCSWARKCFPAMLGPYVFFCKLWTREGLGASESNCRWTGVLSTVEVTVRYHLMTHHPVSCHLTYPLTRSSIRPLTRSSTRSPTRSPT